MAAQLSCTSATPLRSAASAFLLRGHCLTIQTVSGGFVWDWNNYRSLGYTANYWPATRLCSTDCHALVQAIQPVFNPPLPAHPARASTTSVRESYRKQQWNNYWNLGNNIYYSLIIYQDNHFIAQYVHAGQTWFPLGRFMLTTPVFLSFMHLEMASRIGFSITFPGTEVRLIRQIFQNSSLFEEHRPVLSLIILLLLLIWSCNSNFSAHINSYQSLFISCFKALFVSLLLLTHNS